MEKERNKDIFETMPVPLAVRTMALPTIISQLIVLIYNMADTFYLGRTNNPFMVAGVSLILPVFKKNMQGFSVIQLPRGIAPFLSTNENKCLQNTCLA